MNSKPHRSGTQSGEAEGSLLDPLRSVSWISRATILLCLNLAGAAVAGETVGPPAGAWSLADLGIEELVQLPVTSVSKREQRLADTSSSVYVLSNDDLRRSGFTSVAEALRLVPGMNVGTINASQWQISARGFNGLYANKLLVLVDGRAVYHPSYAGVFWDLQQSMLEDVDRIEVIRGPGATVWGANAVNGVVNVMTRSARDTLGTIVYGGGGNVHQALAGARFGDTLGENSYYRIFGGYQLNGSFPTASGNSAEDGWQSWHGGFRADHYPQAETHFTWQSDATYSDLGENSEAYNVNTLGRWNRQFSARSGLELQAYFDRTSRTEALRAGGSSDTVDLAAQHTFAVGERHDVIWGLGYRFTAEHFEETTPLIQIRDDDSQLSLISAFVQDEFQLIPENLWLTAGTKVEHNDFTGFEWQPGVRVVWKPGERQTVWAAISRAVRTPSELEGNDIFAVAVAGPFTGPDGGLYVPRIVGNPDAKSETLWAYEFGYRIQPSRRVSLDLAAFYNQYDKLLYEGPITDFVPGTPFGTAAMPWLNQLEAQTYGGEASVVVTPQDNWRLTAGYSLLLAEVTGPPSINMAVTGSSAPKHQFTLRSSSDLTDRLQLDLQLRYVDRIYLAPGYVTADVRLSYRPTDRWELSLVGQNLLDNQHPERTQPSFARSSEVPRSIYGKVTWRF